LTTCPAGGICSEKTCGGKTLYKLDSCQECYQMSGTTMCILDRCCTVEDVGPCEYGCKVQQALPCASKCKTCKTACESVTAVSCSYGCKSYYSICPSKCEVCNSAPACDCSGYGSAYSEIWQADKHVVVDSCPCNSSYANCYCESGYQYDENNMSCMTEAYMCANYGEYC